METANSVLRLHLDAGAGLDAIYKSISNHAIDRKSHKALHIISITISNADDDESGAVIAVIQGALLERDFPRLLLFVKSREDVSICATKLSEDFLVTSNELLSVTPKWWGGSIINSSQSEEWPGIEISKGLDILPSLIFEKSLCLVDVLSWDDFLNQFAMDLTADTPQSGLDCIDYTVYPQTMQMLRFIQEQRLVLMLQCGRECCACVFDDVEKSFKIVVLARGGVLAKSLFGTCKSLPKQNVTTA